MANLVRSRRPGGAPSGLLSDQAEPIFLAPYPNGPGLTGASAHGTIAKVMAVAVAIHRG